ncbi:MAG: hypothetical protein AAB919_01455 [Patescibacteria group bacterium]
MDREVVLEGKTAQLQHALSKWAERTGFLGPGEKLVFSLSIEAVPLVECRAARSIEKLRHWRGITFRQFYDATCELLKQDGHVSIDGMRAHFKLRPGFLNAVVSSTSPFRLAYFAARNGKPYPGEIDDPATPRSRLEAICKEVGAQLKPHSMDRFYGRGMYAGQGK